MKKIIKSFIGVHLGAFFLSFYFRSLFTTFAV